jgi:hypothetical protein
MLDVSLAACVEFETEMFYSNHPFHVETAKLICNGNATIPRCPMRDACRQEGIDKQEWGIWGGLTERDREQLTGKMPRIATPRVTLPPTPLRLPIRRVSRQLRAAKETLSVPA